MLLTRTTYGFKKYEAVLKLQIYNLECIISKFPREIGPDIVTDMQTPPLKSGHIFYCDIYAIRFY